MSIAKELATMSQTETKLNAVCVPFIRITAQKKLISDAIQVADIENWVPTKKEPRKYVDANELPRAGRTCKQRVILECKQRLFGNHEEETMDDEGAEETMKLSNR